MKDLLLGLSLAGNLFLGYTLLKKTDAFDDLNEKVDSLGNQLSGKAKQVQGAVTGNTADKIEGNIESGKGKLQSKVADVKDELK